MGMDARVIYTQHPIEPMLLARLWADMWPRGVEEIARLGFTLDEAFHRFLAYAKEGPDSMILCADGVPVLVTGVCPEDDYLFTYLQCSNAFPRHSLHATRVLRKRAAVQKIRPIFVYSPLVHEESARWLCALGFKRDVWQGTTAAGWPLYRFRKD